ncbi:hypothetical protein ACTXOR_10545 [Arthrobacter rhombi]|uniref:hypothetical protein n=1 Tax=Arthrobacter rhombi TaxID=71253 RepID=UPI003FD17F44
MAVWIASQPNAHIQATGVDAAGPTQYLYHPRWREIRDSEMFTRSLSFAQSLPAIRRTVSRDLKQDQDPQRRALAATIRLVDRAGLRIGGREYARDNGSYGVSTLQRRHVDVEDGHVHLHFTGKSSGVWDVRLDDDLLYDVFAGIPQTPRSASAVCFATGRRKDWHGVNETDINADLAGHGFTAKDFRTWQGTVVAASSLARALRVGTTAPEAVTAAVQEAAAWLHNTPPSPARPTSTPEWSPRPNKATSPTSAGRPTAPSWPCSRKAGLWTAREPVAWTMTSRPAQEAAVEPPTVRFGPERIPPDGGPETSGCTAALLAAAGRSHGEPGSMLETLRTMPDMPPVPGHGGTAALWELLASVAALDLTAARTLEPHLDAAAILDQAGWPWEPGATWGVFAAEGPGLRLEAARADDDGCWLLHGDKPWCSLAGSLDRAVITAAVPGGRRSFALDLRQTGVVPGPAAWASHGLANVPSGPIRLDDAAATPVGGTDWYLHRDGFAWGGLAVAACWFGGAVGLFRTLHDATGRRAPDQLALAWLGEADRLLSSGAALLAAAADAVDTRRVGWRDAHRVRGQIASLCDRIVAICGQALGPGPLAFDAAHARRVSDLAVYIRQHHAARDDAALGRLVLGEAGRDPVAGGCPW